jgi:hypothetical protein
LEDELICLLTIQTLAGDVDTPSQAQERLNAEFSCSYRRRPFRYMLKRVQITL